MPDIIIITCPECDCTAELFLDDDLICPVCQEDLDGVNFIITNIDFNEID